jgi:PAS domain S-box-containing protein
MAGIRPDEHPEVETRLQRTLNELSRSAERALDPAELVQLVAERACQLLNGDAVALYLWDHAAGLLTPIFSNDSRQPIEDQPLQSGEGAAGQAVLLGQPILVEDYQHWEHAVLWGIERQLRSVEAAPLMVAGRPVGAMIVRFYDRPHALGKDQERTLMMLAAHVAPALEAARLYAATSVERQHERALREIAQALAANLDERKVLELAVSYGAQLLKAPYARVWILQPSGELSCAAAEGFVHAGTFTRRLPPDSTSGLVARQQLVSLADAPADLNWHFNREFGQRTGLGAYLGAGLWRAGESLGVIEVMRQTGHRFTKTEEQQLVSLANTVAVAVSNARAHAAIEGLAREADRRANAVAESELMLRSVYEAIGSGVLVFDGQGAIINANAAAVEILQRPVGELLATRVDDFLPNVREDGSPMPHHERPFLRAVAERRAVRKFVFGITRPDGRRGWLQADAVPLFASDGTVTRVISSFIDVTEQKQAAEALHQRDAILEAVAFAAEQLLTAADWEQSIDDVLRQLGLAAGVSRVYIVPERNDMPGTRDLHQWTADTVRPRPALPDERPYLAAVGLARWEPILREGGTIEGRLGDFPEDEQSVLEKQGVCSIVVVPIFAGQTWWGFIGFDDCTEEQRWPIGTVEVLKTAAGTFGAAILRRATEAERLQLAREQTARAEAEAGQRRLAFLAEASQVLASSLDYETTLQRVADLVVPGLADCCFIDVQEVDGPLRRLASVVAGPFTEMVGDLASPRTGPNRFHAPLTVPLITRSGTAGAITWLLSLARPAFDTRDVHLAQDLARRCALAIDNARLYREARTAVSIRDEFMSVAAHELKTPLTSLRGYAQLLGREFDRGDAANPERARRAAATIQVQSDKLARLVGQLLDISRIQSGKLAIDRRPSDLSALVREVVEAGRTQLKEHVMFARLPTELPVSIDPIRIEQVVTNLIDNAIKYSPQGGQIDITLTAQDDVVRLSVRDRGVGIPPEHRAHIFDRFYQAHAGGALTSMAGMGLGLYISRQIVELHSGTIDVEFPDDGGTMFVVRLPNQSSGPRPA